ncbi:inner membrane-spanning protein YciB [Falsirhodobacter xinxiangensis]|uniref:inner membrane-spanning protein YciB n=1 Tax=Falsirhodobacter xinxiangensis TaxID=2530049 RepID=UPI0010AB1CFD|nr:inner membrane-spanning protein YciB [Rhodobacter xinxiangensis]
MRKVNPIVKMVLELGPVIAFFVAYVKLKDQVFTFGSTEYSGFIVVTAAFIPVLIATTAILWALTGKLSRMQVVTVVMVVVFGGMSVWLNDDRFIKIKPTIVNGLFGAILGFGLLRGQSYLRFVMEEAMPLQPEGWMILTKRLCAMFFGLAISNEIVWRFFSEATWVTFETFAMPAALFAFFMTQGGLLKRYGIENA